MINEVPFNWRETLNKLSKFIDSALIIYLIDYKTLQQLSSNHRVYIPSHIDSGLKHVTSSAQWNEIAKLIKQSQRNHQLIPDKLPMGEIMN